MKPAVALTLSSHLLNEASRFLVYPNKIYRNKSNREVVLFFDSLRIRLLEFRKTFAPMGTVDESAGLLADTFVDEIYCREVLEDVPSRVRRTQALAHRPIAGVPDSEALVYLREAATCFIHGLPQACVALARASMEAGLRRHLSVTLGEKAVLALDLVAVVDRSGLPPALKAVAHRVRRTANSVLHSTTATEATALECFEDARAVLQHLSR